MELIPYCGIDPSLLKRPETTCTPFCAGVVLDGLMSVIVTTTLPYHTCTFGCLCLHTHTCIHVYQPPLFLLYSCMFILYTTRCMLVYLYACMLVYLYTCNICLYVCILVYLHAYTLTYPGYIVARLVICVSTHIHVILY
jgi:hypothetical protein